MDKLTPKDVMPLEEYRRRRPEQQKAMMALRARRRVLVGERVSLSFENRDTVLYQIHEMCYAEGIRDPDKIAHEVETYNALVPDPGALAATLMIELVEAATLREDLDRFLGLDRPGVLRLGAGNHVVPAAFEEGHATAERIAAVHYVRFKLSEAALGALRQGAEARLVIAHPHYQAMTRIEGETRRELLADLG